MRRETEQPAQTGVGFGDGWLGLFVGDGAFAGGGSLVKEEFVGASSDLDEVAFVEGSFQNLLGERVFEETFHGAAHGTSAVLGIVAFFDEELLGFFVEHEP